MDSSSFAKSLIMLPRWPRFSLSFGQLSSSFASVKYTPAPPRVDKAFCIFALGTQTQ